MDILIKTQAIGGSYFMKEFNITLTNGVKMPILGLGVYKTLDAAEMQRAVTAAADAGYRSFDTAQMYGNEALLGNALARISVPRSRIFLTSKINTTHMSYEKALASFQESLRNLRTDYLDLLLIHWPGQKRARLTDTWRALEKLYRDGSVRAIGMSNAEIRHLRWLHEDSEIAPMLNQIERHPLLNEAPLAAWCRQHEIALEAWGPLLRGHMDLPEISAMAARYQRTPAQIILRWDIQSGYIVIPKSVHEERIRENANIFDFALAPADMKALDAMDTGHHTSWDPESYDF